MLKLAFFDDVELHYVTTVTFLAVSNEYPINARIHCPCVQNPYCSRSTSLGKMKVALDKVISQINVLQLCGRPI